MEDSLVFFLVWTHAIHPAYVQHKRRCADSLHRIMCPIGTVRERHICGMMEVLEYVSNSILIEYGYATPWYMRDVDCSPLRLRALDIAMRPHPPPRRSNTLGGFRI